MRTRSWLSLCILLLLPLLGCPYSTLACSIDGVPSISANGILAHPTRVAPTAATRSLWAPFIFLVIFRVGTPIRFAEDVHALRTSLPPHAFDRPWRWALGDGSVGSGFGVSHSYGHPGDYLIGLWAYYDSYRAWYKFDSVVIHTR